jgi:hypothetical protein
MANPGMRHAYKSTASDPVDTSLVGKTKWNDRHYLLEDDGTTAAGALGDLLYRGAAGLVTNIPPPMVNVLVHGAVGDGSTDDTAAIQAVITALDGVGGTVFFPEGLYKITSTLTIPSGVSLVGASQLTSILVFEPTGADTLLYISEGASINYSGSIRELRLYAQETTFAKIAIDMVDADNWLIERVIITGNTSAGGSSYWGGNTSTGIQTRGRNNCTIRNCVISADKPLVIAQNPNNAIDIDHFHFEDLIMVGNGNPIVTIEDGVNLTHVTFDGYQAWVKGTDGLKWADTTTVAASTNLTLRNVRHEQGTSATSYVIDIAHNHNLHGLIIHGVYGGLGMRGIKLRKVKWATIQNYEYLDTTREAFNIDSTVDPVTLINAWAQTGSTASMSGVVTQFSIEGNPSALPLFAVYGAGDSEMQSTLIQKFGGATSAFPMLKRSSTTLRFELADESGALTAFTAGGNCALAADSAPQAGGNAAHRVTLSSTAGLGVYFGSGAPSVSAAQGSLYLRTDGSSTTTRLYVNTNGTTGWTNVVTST